MLIRGLTSRAFYTAWAVVIVALISAAAHVGCSEELPDSSAEAAEEINKSGSGLVKVSEAKEIQVVSKYLTPRYLATAEGESRTYSSNAVDSLAQLYSQTMSFHVGITTDIENGMAGVSANAVGLQPGSIMDIETQRRAFRLESGGDTWYPVCALPESRVGQAEQTWFVVFALDPERELRGQDSITLVYAPDSGDAESEKLKKEAVRFTYNVNDILRTEIIASTN